LVAVGFAGARVFFQIFESVSVAVRVILFVAPVHDASATTTGGCESTETVTVFEAEDCLAVSMTPTDCGVVILSEMTRIYLRRSAPTSTSPNWTPSDHNSCCVVSAGLTRGEQAHARDSPSGVSLQTTVA
jgi:hypothetical protein